MAKLLSGTRIYGTATVDTQILLNGSISASSTTTGALQVVGGVGIGGAVYIGQTSYINNSQILTSSTFGQFITSGVSSVNAGTDTAINTSTGAVTIWNTSTLQSITGRGSSTNYAITLQNTTNATSTTTGALQVQGGVGIGGNLYVGSSATIGTPVTGAVVQAVYSNNSLYSSYTSAVISNASSQNLDTFSTSTYRTAKYVVQIYDSSKVHVEEFMLFHDNTSAYLTEYAVATNTGELGAFDANISAGTMTLTFTPNYTPSAMTIKVVRTAITA